MTPIDEATDRANEIARSKYSNMLVTISLGGEYINAYDVDADVATAPVPPAPPVKDEMPMATTKETVAEIQRLLNELGAKPTLIVDGIIGRATLTAMRAFLLNAKQ